MEVENSWKKTVPLINYDFSNIIMIPQDLYHSKVVKYFKWNDFLFQGTKTSGLNTE